MMLHFGDTTAKEQNLYMDLDRMKVEYKRMESWNPNVKVYRPYLKGYDEEKVNSIADRLMEKTRAAQGSYH